MVEVTKEVVVEVIKHVTVPGSAFFLKKKSGPLLSISSSIARAVHLSLAFSLSLFLALSRERFLPASS